MSRASHLTPQLSSFVLPYFLLPNKFHRSCQVSAWTTSVVLHAFWSHMFWKPDGPWVAHLVWWCWTHSPWPILECCTIFIITRTRFLDSTIKAVPLKGYVLCGWQYSLNFLNTGSILSESPASAVHKSCLGLLPNYHQQCGCLILSGFSFSSVANEYLVHAC